MFAGKECGRWALALSLALVTVASAAATGGNCDREFVAESQSTRSAANITFAPEPGQIWGARNPSLSRIGEELLAPPVGSSDWLPSPSSVRPLPGVPAGVFMVLTGFLCVSLVKDHRIWLAALTGLLWLGQAGLLAIPELACHIASSKQIKQHCRASVTGIHKDEYGGRTRSSLDGTEYIGLLRHLAGIPDIIASYSTLILPPSLGTRRSSAGAVHEYTRTQEFALVTFGAQETESTSCPARAAEQFLRFSPAFIFSNLARGPPLSACEK